MSNKACSHKIGCKWLSILWWDSPCICSYMKPFMHLGIYCEKRHSLFNTTENHTTRQAIINIKNQQIFIRLGLAFQNTNPMPHFRISSSGNIMPQFFELSRDKIKFELHNFSQWCITFQLTFTSKHNKMMTMCWPPSFFSYGYVNRKLVCKKQ